MYLFKQFNKYGNMSKFGSEIPITVIGIVMKINQILLSIIIGIAAGSQPIVGFNYGAQKYDRVKENLKIVLGLSILVSVIAFILFQAIPEKLIGIFGSGDVLYNEFACISFRIFLMLTLVNGIQVAAGIFFQAIGRPGKSAFLTLSRQILFFVPASIVLSKFFDIMGVIYAGPVADSLAFLVAVILLIVEMKQLGKQTDEDYVMNDDTTVATNTVNNIIVTVAREYGSGGRYVARILAEKLGIKFYDNDLIEIVSNESGLSAKYIEENEQNIHGNLLSSFNTQYSENLSNDDNLFIAESKAIKEIADKGACVIVGRCANNILKDKENVINIFLYSDDENKVKRAVTYYGLNEKTALNEIRKINENREKHYKYYTNEKWRNMSNYDLSINVDKLGVEKTAEMIEEFIKGKQKALKV